MLTSHSRGQTLPIWAMGIAGALVLAFAAMQYGEVLRWQVRAQNAADAAASAALAVQTQTWNQQLALVYAAAVEEWRIKNLLNGMQAAAYNDPGCAASGCQATFDALKREYMRAVARYTTDVQLVNRTSQYTIAQAQSDAQAMVKQLSTNCGKANGGDCAFAYNVVRVQARTAPVNTVEQDGGAWVINNPGTPATVKPDYTPAQIEVVTCAKVAPIVPSFLGFTPPTFTAIGRAAATSAGVTQEWIQPGYLTNPRTGQLFQPVEQYGPATTATGPNGWNWFTVNYGGNSAKAFPKLNAYAERVKGPEFSAVTGWWNTVPMKPFTGALDMGTVTCNAS
jgi:hypothetical protein